MDELIIVKLDTLEVYDFCNQCKAFNCDIDLIDRSNVLDAKDYDHIILLAFNRNFCVSINSNDEQEILKFNKVMDKYKIE